MNLKQQLEQRISAALAAAGAADCAALVGVSANAKFGDYQANGVMAAAKKLKLNPRQLADKVVAALGEGAEHDITDLAGKIEVAGPGFINITISDALLHSEVARAAGDERLDVAKVTQPQTVVVDYSAPNLAKEMHVGHLRSTIIGDAIANVLEFLGHNVIRQNHVGDYGTQFGMLIAYMDLLATEGGEGAAQSSLSDLEDFYRKARKRFDDDAAFADMARQYVVRLQSGDADTVTKWKRFLELSLAHCRQVYSRLNVNLRDEHIRGESSYGDALAGVVADLDKAGLLKESQGAQCVFLDGYANKEGEPLPLIVQKSDEGYLYATTDLAAIRYRLSQLHADRVLYVVGSPQSQHFAMVFDVARQAGFASADVSLEHISFGTMLGQDGKPFKTRVGGTVKLAGLLDEAHERAFVLVSEKNADEVAAGRSELMSDEKKHEIAEAVGIGAVKYADLSMDRTSDYKFAWEKMIALQGNTAPYMQYAYARIRSIFRKDEAGRTFSSGGLVASAPGLVASANQLEDERKLKTIQLIEPAEIALGKAILRFEEVLQAVATEAKPNMLTAYLYDLAGAFTTFYENCPVLKSDEPVRSSRLALCDLTARTIKKGLELLGIRVIEQM